jgi:hypothetical protein
MHQNSMAALNDSFGTLEPKFLRILQNPESLNTLTDFVST